MDEAVTRSLWASILSVRPWVRPDTGDGSNLKLALVKVFIENAEKRRR